MNRVGWVAALILTVLVAWGYLHPRTIEVPVSVVTTVGVRDSARADSIRIDTVVISSQHSPDVSHKNLTEGIIEEASGKALDACLNGAAQAIEHYEILRYGTLRRWAKELG